MNKKIISAFLALAIVSMACGFDINLPDKPTKIEETTEEIKAPYPKEENPTLELKFGAGELNISGGSENLIEGTATYNYEEFKPVITNEDDKVKVSVGDSDNFDFIPAFDEIINTWDIKLGDQPMNLEIDAGGYEGRIELGGLSLTNLDIADGAADVVISFSEPNQTEMKLFDYDTGASNVKLEGLANANFSIFNFSSGAGDYTLDFSGELQRDATVNLDSGLSNVILNIPEGVHAIITVEGGALNVSTESGWSTNGSVYEQDGEGPTLTIIVEMGAGNLTITD